MNKTAKWLTISAVILLLGMTGLHISGIGYLTGKIRASNLPEFLKDIFPVLFAHPSIHLLGLAAFAILALWLREAAWKVLILVAVLVLTDGLVAFYLGALEAGLLLLVAAILFALAGRISKSRS